MKWPRSDAGDDGYEGDAGDEANRSSDRLSMWMNVVNLSGGDAEGHV